MRKVPVSVLVLILIGSIAALGWRQVTNPNVTGPKPPVAAVAGANAAQPAHIELWEPLTSGRYASYEKMALVANVVVALAGLAYALMLVGQVKRAPQGTPRMQEIAQAIREGADAYLFRQFRVVGVLIVLIT